MVLMWKLNGWMELKDDIRWAMNMGYGKYVGTYLNLCGY
jgi:hypothetical protein